MLSYKLDAAYLTVRTNYIDNGFCSLCLSAVVMQILSKNSLEQPNFPSAFSRERVGPIQRRDTP